ncbi:hypothetical protein GUITHDRAFT_152265 [Guillardia theta CCMP2712]|uniref:Uncharacterized protein n=1 Tax=Guillardia theta (strain CCMP2712) TaxID=905079 RepID=L1JEN5_GUITC|nr:hypothetical protein GUITHDRAFT_152265 [Guillardia theta CCMP2712]EKX46998.1 hypothetical protein GUITHDRAFT_152265 [Guillardia theta CCMP2712]|eukprot:XP_005833978.1 hypothetical protein GUITHDRAFT_152265 [Guillardia theta CCMP2712]
MSTCRSRALARCKVTDSQPNLQVPRNQRSATPNHRKRFTAPITLTCRCLRPSKARDQTW